MRNFVMSGLLCYGLLSGGLVLRAQTYPNGPHERVDPYNRETAGGDYGFGLFDRVQADLDRAEYSAYGAHGRIQHAHKEVHDFQSRLSRGRFDKGELDEAIAAVQHVADSSSIRGRERAALLDDLARMREFRATRGAGYGRPYPDYRQ